MEEELIGKRLDLQSTLPRPMVYVEHDLGYRMEMAHEGLNSTSVSGEAPVTIGMGGEGQCAMVRRDTVDDALRRASL